MGNHRGQLPRAAVSRCRPSHQGPGGRPD